MVKKAQKINKLEQFSLKVTNWVGTPISILVHTAFFVIIFGLSFIGFSTDQILLILTTAVSLEAIYLAIFIQMTVNRNTESLEAVEEDIDDIQEDVEELEEDIDKIQAEQDEDENRDIQEGRDLDRIERHLQTVLKELETLKKNRSV